MMTSCAISDYTVSSGDAILFPDVRVQVGIDNMSTYLSTGKFVCSKPGLYLVSTWVLVPHGSSSFIYIYLNNKWVARSFTSNSNHYDTGIATVALELQINDKVSIRHDNSRVDSYGTCMTVVKIM